MKKIPNYIENILLIIAFLAIESMNSQNAPGTPPPPGLPIDGGVFILLVLGIAFGVTSLRRGKK